MRVRNRTYGEGVIREIWGSGDAPIYTVEFPTGAVRHYRAIDGKIEPVG